MVHVYIHLQNVFRTIVVLHPSIEIRNSKNCCGLVYVTHISTPRPYHRYRLCHSLESLMCFYNRHLETAFC